MVAPRRGMNGFLWRGAWFLGASGLWACGPLTPLQDVKPSIQVNPSEIHVDSALASSHERQVLVSNTGDGPLHLHAQLVEPVGAGWGTDSGSWEVAPGQTRMLTVRFVSQAVGASHAVLRLEHNAQPNPAGQQRVDVGLHAQTALPLSCDDNNPCTLDLVDAAMPQGCAHTPQAGPCDDGSACTVEDACSAGLCVGQARSCDDQVDCTVDSCNAQTGCVFAALAARCADGDPCTEDVCDPVLAEGSSGCLNPTRATGSPCGAADCTTLHLCVAGACTTVDTPEGYPCEDGNSCTLGDVCTAGVCQPGAVAGAGDAQPRELWSTDAQLGLPWAVDAVGAVLSNAQEALVVWRGANMSTCTEDPVSCSYSGSACAAEDALRGRMSLWAGSFAVPGGGLQGQAAQVLDTTSLYRMVWGATVQDVPLGTVAAARAIPYAGSRGNQVLAWVAVHYGSTYEEGCAARTSAVIPSGHILALLNVGDHDGGGTSFNILYARWVGPVPEVTADTSSPPGAPLALGLDGLPLLAIHADQAGSGNPRVDAAWVTVPPCTTCGDEPGPISVVGHAAQFQVANGFFSVDALVESGFAMDWPGPSGWRDFDLTTVNGIPSMWWRQQTSADFFVMPEPCPSLHGEMMDLMAFPIAAGPFLVAPTPTIQASLVNYGRLLDAEGGPQRIVWGVDCVQRVTAPGPVGERVLVESWDGPLWGGIQADLVNGAPLVTTKNVTGDWNLTWAPDNQPLQTLNLRWGGASQRSFLASQPGVFATGAEQQTVLFAVGSNNMPEQAGPILTMTPLGCWNTFLQAGGQGPASP